MNFALLIAQATPEAADIFGLAVASIVVLGLLIGLCNTFIKAGKPGWLAVVPIYNMITLLRIAKRPWWYLITFGIPIFGLVMMVLVWIEAIRSTNQSMLTPSTRQPHYPPTSESKSRVLAAIDFPMLLAAVLTVAFYVVMQQPSLKNSFLYRYTCEHLVEYVVVAFFIWGIVDILFKLCGFPTEMLALREHPLQPRTAKEPVANALAMQEAILAQPQWFLRSRFGERLVRAFGYIQERESAEGFNDYLHHLAVQDEDRTYTNFALVRFICWVSPVLGILGTVIHFGSAFGGLSVDEIGDNLGKVIGEIGTAFDTTTGALAAAISMMFSLFLCERIERGIIHSIDRRMDLELLNRFEVTDENITPFLNAVQASNQAGLSAMDEAVERQLQIWSTAFHQLQQQSEERLQTHAQLWEQSLAKVHQHFESSDAEREKRLTRVLGEIQAQRGEQKAVAQGVLNQMAAMHTQYTQLVEAMSSVSRDGGQLVKLQHTLSENLRIIHETQQLDQALHGLTGAIHLLTARHDLTGGKAAKAA